MRNSFDLFRLNIWEILYSFARRDSLVALSGKSGMKAAARKMPQSCIREVEEEKTESRIREAGGKRENLGILSKQGSTQFPVPSFTDFYS